MGISGYRCSPGNVFSENIGLSFGQYLKCVRLLFALNMMTNTSETLRRMALDCGFSSQSVFSREFRNYYKKAPTAFRNGPIPKGELTK